ncbi:cupin domain-containing protein [Varunaivibrio sulfuroxidans]|uniref:XRE family transcriptional regulator n=1 Tax=Varunaivibrio sulfuroxidans TaxID=1773489 RepID=A0A4R3JDC5_9PROT|nr:cupin domain-containing protein [Varunaivibrio sulfuroxidans]TCS63405.1 XRE family transcriptional regulator [Varunaivibrio sulfuroxidans]WES30449.1 cupin domain-containing protein [Varunaivibrio sulfuroxidans]
MSSDIGARLKAVRSIYNLSQRELARLAGVTNSTISLIEQNKVSPSIDSLKKVLSGFSMSLITFLTLDLDVEEKVFYAEDELVAFDDNGTTLRLVGAMRKHRALRFLHETYIPGAHSGEKLLSSDGEEAGIVIKGKVELTVGHKVRVLEEGEAYYIDTKTPHRFRNTSDAECVVVSAATPPSF